MSHIELSHEPGVRTEQRSRVRAKVTIAKGPLPKFLDGVDLKKMAEKTDLSRTWTETGIGCVLGMSQPLNFISN